MTEKDGKNSENCKSLMDCKTGKKRRKIKIKTNKIKIIIRTFFQTELILFVRDKQGNPFFVYCMNDF